MLLYYQVLATDSEGSGNLFTAQDRNPSSL